MRKGECIIQCMTVAPAPSSGKRDSQRSQSNRYLCRKSPKRNVNSKSGRDVVGRTTMDKVDAVNVYRPKCGRSAEVVPPREMGRRSFRCRVCDTIGVIQPKASIPVPPDDYICAVCAVEITPTTLRQINGQTYCVKCASKVEKHQKRLTAKSWNDFKDEKHRKKH
jgi:hypothetical protein